VNRHPDVSSVAVGAEEAAWASLRSQTVQIGLVEKREAWAGAPYSILWYQPYTVLEEACSSRLPSVLLLFVLLVSFPLRSSHFESSAPRDHLNLLYSSLETIRQRHHDNVYVSEEGQMNRDLSTSTTVWIRAVPFLLGWDRSLYPSNPPKFQSTKLFGALLDLPQHARIGSLKEVCASLRTQPWTYHCIDTLEIAAP
jgi:hypothetical protein